jgi:hypothetical protein
MAEEKDKAQQPEAIFLEIVTVFVVMFLLLAGLII